MSIYKNSSSRRITINEVIKVVVVVVVVITLVFLQQWMAVLNWWRRQEVEGRRKAGVENPPGPPPTWKSSGVATLTKTISDSWLLSRMDTDCSDSSAVVGDNAC